MLTPPIHTGIKQLQKELFVQKQVVGALLVDVRHLREVQTIKKEGMLNLPRIPSILNAPGTKSQKMVLLDPNIDFSAVTTLPKKIQQFVHKTNSKLTQHTITLDYDYWTAEQILRAIIPPELDVPGSFATVGHIAHFNLKEEYEPYKKIIGDVILTKAHNIKTVVNKLDTIDHTFRFFKMELLAGKEDYVTTLKESDCQFTFDFSQVYWNSRLQGEHHRLISLFKKGDIICDVFGGVGPFALPAAKLSQAFVFANDLNPKSYEYLVQNIVDNKVKDRVKGYNMDGREFIKRSLELVNEKETWNDFEENLGIYIRQRRKGDRKEMAKEFDSESTKYPHHYIMNLPASAIDFLDTFIGLYQGKNIDKEKLPYIHCYCFSKADNKIQDTIQVFLSHVARRSDPWTTGGSRCT
jgi:tRNA (guanine37-N1)-methyltransferase